tara:strand:+ start:11158 stop:12510 length:1353 start_codon:yes stop_codon:yes gene_type:complete
MNKEMKFFQRDLLSLGIQNSDKVFKRELYDEFRQINFEEESSLQDLTSLFCFSIDGEFTTDRDDVFSFEKNIGENTYSLGIHITNVASFIPPKSLIDIEASKRSSSIYSLDENIPMLPKYFTEKFGSLDQYKIRKCLSVILKIDNQANILSSDIIISKVENNLALKYEDIELILNNKGHKLCSIFEQLYSISVILNNRRLIFSDLKLNSPSIEVKVLENGKIDLRVDQFSCSRLIVSELMILYNRIIAEYCYNSKLPAIYRTQEKIRFMDLDLQNLPSIVKRYRVFKEMEPVIFNTNPSPHFFMGLDRYIQVTSPLRRYFDLIMQRQIISYKFCNKIIYTLDDLKLMIEESELKLKAISKFDKERERFWVIRYFDQILDELIYNKLDRSFVGVVLESNIDGFALLELEEIPYRFKCFIPDVCFQGDRINFTINNVDLVSRTISFMFRNKI